MPEDRDDRRPLQLRIAALVVVFVGGAFGTLARYGLEVLSPAGAGRWPWGTFVANLAGAFVLGALLEGLARGGADPGRRRHVRLLIGTGFCGGLTTYSTFAVEIDLLVRSHDRWLALGYAIVTLAAGLIATVAGIAAASRYQRTGARSSS